MLCDLKAAPTRRTLPLDPFANDATQTQTQIQTQTQTRIQTQTQTQTQTQAYNAKQNISIHEAHGLV